MSSSAQFDSSFEAFREQAKPKEGMRLTERFCDVSQFLFRLRVQMQYGQLSRAPLKLLRLEILPDMCVCDCMARAGDRWDDDLPDRMARRHVTLQALRDAIDLRALLYRAMPDAMSAHIRIFRDGDFGRRELIMVGNTHRNDQSAREVHSLTMRAKVLGFRFRVEDDSLRTISDDEYPVGGDKVVELA